MREVCVRSFILVYAKSTSGREPKAKSPRTVTPQHNSEVPPETGDLRRKGWFVQKVTLF